MSLTMEVSERDKKLLAIVLVILIIVLYWQALLSPAIDTVSENKEALETAEAELEELESQVAQYDVLVHQLESWEESNAELTSQLYPLAASWQIDRFLNFVIKSCGMTIQSLSIEDTLEYYIDSNADSESGESNLVLADPETVEANAEDYSSYTETGEYLAQFTYELTCNYDQIVTLVNFVDHLSFLGLSDLSFNNSQLEDEESESVEEEEEEEEEDTTEELTEDEIIAQYFDDYYTINLTINAYMYSDPITSDDEAEEETTEAAETETSEEDSDEEDEE